MLRTRVRSDPRQLRQLFENLSRLKKERSVTLNELPLPIPGKAPVPQPAKSPARARSRQPLQKFKSVNDLQKAAEKDEEDWRVFEQVDEAPRFLEVPNARRSHHQPPLNDYASMVDRATGIDMVWSSVKLLKEDKFLLRKLVDAMMLANKPDTKIVREVFTWLQRFSGKPHLLKLLTPYAWKFLWALDVSAIPTLRSRMIGDLMAQVGASFTEEQEVAYIGGLFWSDAREQALNRWQDLVKRTPTSTVWNLGIRLFSLERNPEQAEKVLEEKVSMFGTTEHHTWIPIIMSYNHIYQSDKAWNGYEKLHFWANRNGEAITTGQYDDLAMSFLDSYQPGMGLEIYKSMLYSGKTALERTNTETYKNLASAIKEAQNLSDSPDELNGISFDALKTLPPAVSDKYFFGGWMKNLMKMGRTDLAWFVARDVMASRGIRADSIHCNWALQGFLEEGNMDMATRVADEMIAARSKQIGKGPVEPESDSPGTPFTAPATIQTFSLLINHYTRRQNMSHVVTLCSQMIECEIKSNSYIMNHLLHALFRTNDMCRLSRAFQEMTTTGEVVPDQESFLIMWTAMYKNYTMSKRSNMGVITPRGLFKSTLKGLSAFTGRQEDSHRRIRAWHHMIKSFMLARDIEGTLLALYAGSKLLRLPIDETIVRETAFGVMRMRSWNPSVTGHIRPRVDPDELRDSVVRLRHIGEHIRMSKLRKRGRLQPRAPAPLVAPDDGTLESLGRLLKVEMGESNLVVEKMAKARAEMGLEGIQLGIMR